VAQSGYKWDHRFSLAEEICSNSLWSRCFSGFDFVFALTLFFPYFSPCLRAASLPWRASVVGFAFAFAFTFAFAFAFALAFAFTQRPKAKSLFVAKY